MLDQSDKRKLEDKRKNSPYKPIKAWSFMFWWVLASFVALPVSLFIAALITIAFLALASTFPSDWLANPAINFGIKGVMVLTIGAVIGFCLSDMQWRLIGDYLHSEAKDWRRNSIIGGAIGLGIAAIFLSLIRDAYYNEYGFFDGLFHETNLFKPSITFCLLIFLTFLSIAQALILRRIVENAWLWVLANGFGAIIFMGSAMRNYDYDVSWNMLGMFLTFFLFNYCFSILSLGFVTGCVMLVLFQKRRESSKQKLVSDVLNYEI